MREIDKQRLADALQIAAAGQPDRNKYLMADTAWGTGKAVLLERIEF